MLHIKLTRPSGLWKRVVAWLYQPAGPDGPRPPVSSPRLTNGAYWGYF